MNKVIITGRLTADPELRQTQSGISTCRFTVAVDRQFADKETGERQADFITCVAWRQTADFVTKYFTKGKMIAIDGRLQTGSYKDRNHEDVTHYTTDVYVNAVEFCGSKSESAQTSSYATPQQPSSNQAINNTPNSNAANNAASVADTASLAEFEEILNDGGVPF